MGESPQSSDESFKEHDTLIDQEDDEVAGVCSKWIKTKSSRLAAMLTLIGIYFLAEIIVGHITDSLTLVADSFHMLSDGLSLIVALTAVRMSKRKAHQSITPWPFKQQYFNTFGWVRFEVVGALINATFLLALCISILMEAMEKLYEPQLVSRPELILAVGAGGLLINIFGLVMFGSHAHAGHDHSHGHDHGHHHYHVHGNHDHKHSKEGDESNGKCQKDVESGKEEKVKKVSAEEQMNMRAVFLHVLGDALGSVIVMISATLVLLIPHNVVETVLVPSNETIVVNGTNVTHPPKVKEIQTIHNHWILYMDPVMSMLLVLIMVSTTAPLFKKSSLILLQTVPQKMNIHSIKKKMEEIVGVLEIHDFHIWQLAGDKYVATVHLQCADAQTYLSIAKEMKDKLHDEDIHSLTIQPEFNMQSPTRHCSMLCASEKCKTKVCCEIEEESSKKKSSKSSMAILAEKPLESDDELKVTFSISPSPSGDCVTLPAPPTNDDTQ